MLNTEKSKFHVYSIGTVAKDKPEGTFIIEIVAIESNNLFNDNLDETEKEKDVTTKDRNGVDIPKISKTSQTLKAEWIGLGFGGNRATAPDVKQGEKVIIYRYSDEDKYYWECIYTEHSLRRLERVLYLYSGQDVKPGLLNDTSNSYWMLISTLDKLLRLHTSSSNGEPYDWDFILNTAEGNFTYTDNSGISKEHDAPSATVTHRTRYKEHFLTENFIVDAYRKSTISSGSGGIFFGPNSINNDSGGF